MRQSEILALYQYNWWATDRILDTAAALTPEEYNAPIDAEGSIRILLSHTLAAEWIWRKRLEESISPSAMPDYAEATILADLRTIWDEERANWVRFLAGLTDEAIQSEMRYRSTKGKEFPAPMWIVLAHVVNHGTQHRSEIAQALTNLGHSPDGLDLIYWLRIQQGLA